MKRSDFAIAFCVAFCMVVAFAAWFAITHSRIAWVLSFWGYMVYWDNPVIVNAIAGLLVNALLYMVPILLVMKLARMVRDSN